MGRKYRGGKGQNLPFIHNVRPAMEFSDRPPKRAGLLMTMSLLITVVGLLIFVFRG